MGERAVYSTMAHVFQIDQETKKKWIPSSSSAVKVSYYHDPARKTYRIITIDNSKALVNSTITANMNFTKTSPKFGQWSDHRANTVFGLGFSSESDLVKFIDMFNEAKQAARELMKERQLAAQRLQDQDKPHPPSGSALSPTSPPFKSPSVTTPPALITNSASKSPSPSLTSPGPHEVSVVADISAVEGGEIPSPTERFNTFEAVKSEGWESEGGITNGGSSSPVEPIKMSNGHTSLDSDTSSPDGKLDSLKTENNRLKLALASSATNVKKWESEMQTLKNNNTRLQTALEESKVNVSQWKAQLQKYKEENDSLKKKVQQLDGVRRKESIQTVEEMTTIKKENEELKEVLSAVQIDLEMKTEDAQAHAMRADSADEELVRIKSKLEMLEEDNQNYISHLSMLEDQFKMASIASKRKIEDVQQKHKDIGHKLKELVELHTSLEGHLEA